MKRARQNNGLNSPLQTIKSIGIRIGSIMDNVENLPTTPTNKTGQGKKRLPIASPFSSVTPSQRKPLKQNRQVSQADPSLEETYLETTVCENVLDGSTPEDVAPVKGTSSVADPNLEVTCMDDTLAMLSGDSSMNQSKVENNMDISMAVEEPQIGNLNPISEHPEGEEANASMASKGDIGDSTPIKASLFGNSGEESTPVTPVPSDEAIANELPVAINVSEELVNVEAETDVNPSLSDEPPTNAEQQPADVNSIETSLTDELEDKTTSDTSPQEPASSCFLEDDKLSDDETNASNSSVMTALPTEDVSVMTGESPVIPTVKSPVNTQSSTNSSSLCVSFEPTSGTDSSFITDAAAMQALLAGFDGSRTENVTEECNVDETSENMPRSEATSENVPLSEATEHMDCPKDEEQVVISPQPTINAETNIEDGGEMLEETGEKAVVPSQDCQVKPSKPIGVKTRKSFKAPIDISPITNGPSNVMADSPPHNAKSSKYSDSMIEFLEIENKVMIEVDRERRLANIPEADFDAMRKERDEAVSMLDEMKRTKDMLDKDLEDMRKAKEFAERDKRDFEYMYEMSQKKLEDLRKNTNRQINDLQEEVEIAQKRDEGRTPLVEGLQAEIERLNEQMEKERETQTAREEELKKERDNALVKMNEISCRSASEVESLKQSIASLNSDLAGLVTSRESVEEISSQLAEMTEQKEKAETRLSDMAKEMDVIVSQLKADCEETRLELNEMKETYSKSKDELVSTEEKLSAANQLIEELQQRVEQGTNEIAAVLEQHAIETRDLQSKLDGVNVSHEEALNRLKNVEATAVEVAGLQEKIASLEIQLSESEVNHQKEIDCLASASNEQVVLLESSLSSLKTEMDVLCEQKKLFEAQLVEKDEQIAALQTELSETKSTHQHELESVTSVLREKVVNAESALSLLNVEIATLSESKALLETKLAEKNEEYSTVLLQLDNVKAEVALEKDKSTSLAAELETLRLEASQLSTLKEANEGLRSKSEQNALLISTLTTDLEEQRKRVEEHQTKHEEDLTAINKLSDELREKGFREEKLRAEMAMQAEHAAEVEAALTICENKKKSVETELNEVRGCLGEISAKADILQMELGEMKGAKEKIAELPQIYDKLEELKETIVEMEKARNLAMQAADEVRSSIAIATEEAASLRSELSEKNELVARNEAALKSCEEEKRALEAELVTARQNADNARIEADEAKREKGKLKTTISEGMAEFNKYKEQARVLGTTVNELRLQAAELEHKLSEAPTAEEVQELKDKFASEKEELQAKLDLAQTEVDRLEKVCDEFDVDEAKLNSQIHSLVAELNELKGKRRLGSVAGPPLLNALVENVRRISPEPSLNSQPPIQNASDSQEKKTIDISAPSSPSALAAEDLPAMGGDATLHTTHAGAHRGDTSLSSSGRCVQQ